MEEEEDTTYTDHPQKHKFKLASDSVSLYNPIPLWLFSSFWWQSLCCEPPAMRHVSLCGKSHRSTADVMAGNKTSRVVFQCNLNVCVRRLETTAALQRARTRSGANWTAGFYKCVLNLLCKVWTCPQRSQRNASWPDSRQENKSCTQTLH